MNGVFNNRSNGHIFRDTLRRIVKSEKLTYKKPGGVE